MKKTNKTSLHNFVLKTNLKHFTKDSCQQSTSRQVSEGHQAAPCILFFKNDLSAAHVYLHYDTHISLYLSQN